jgi:hypothetical protein
MKNSLFKVAIAIGVIAFVSPAVANVQNVALTSDGATFVSASSTGYYEVQQFGLSATAPQTTMQSNLLTATPTSWLSDTDTRYFFSQTDTDQYVIINLGANRDLQSFGASWNTGDRPAASLSVFYATSSTGPWTQIGSSVVSPGSNVITGSVDAEYLKYDFGSASQQYANNPPFGGSGIGEVYANAAVPEPATWALMLLGFAGLGFASYRVSRKSAALAA